MKNERFYNSRIFDRFKQFICIFSCFVLCICLFPSSLALAYSSSDLQSIIYYSSIPGFNNLNNDTVISSLLRSGTQKYNNAILTINDPSIVVVPFHVGTMTYYCIDSYFTYQSSFLQFQSYGSSTTTVGISNFSNYNSTYNIKYISVDESSSNLSNHVYYIPGFNSLDSGLSAVRNFIDNPPSTGSIIEVPFINSDPSDIDPSDALYIGTATNDIYIYQRVNKPICTSIINGNFAFSSLSQNARYVIVQFNNGNYVSYQEGICNVAYNSPDTFYSNNMFAVPINHNTSIASYSDSSSWQSDVYDFLQTTHSQALLNKPLILNPGNVIWIEAESDTIYNIQAEFDVLSDLFGNTWNPHTMQFGRNNIIQQGQYPIQGGNDLVPTTNNSDDSNMVGQSKIGYTTITHGSSTYIYIYNPYYRRYAPGLTYVTNLHNPVLTITPSKPVYNAVYLPLDNQLNLTTGIVGSTDSDNSQSVSIDPNTGDYIYSGVVNGEDTSSTTPPPSGGQNLQNVAQGNTLGITDYLNKITETITEFTNNILELVKAPISHIGQLIDSGSGFMSALRGLYAWLPVDIQGLVISALTVVIGIGIFKVFL